MVIKQKQKILFLTRTLGRAGVAVSLISVLKALDLEKFDVTLGVQFPIKELENEIPASIRVIYYGDITSSLYRKLHDINSKLAAKKRNVLETGLWHLLNKLEELRMAYKVRYCFKDQYDTANAYHQGVASRYVMKRINAKKKIMWYHAAKIEQPWYKKLFAKADLIITDSENARQIMLKEWGGDFASKTVSMHCLIPIEEIQTKAKESVDIEKQDGQLLLMSCGRLSEEKGMDLAVRAAAHIANARPEVDFRWIIVGGGPESDRLEQLSAELGIADKVKMVGFKSNPYPYFDVCDIYVQPSRLECFGITMAEALALGKPVISTDTAGGQENVKNGVNGMLTEINDKSLAQAVISLLDDTDMYHTLCENVRQKDYGEVRASATQFINSVEMCNKK